MASSTLTPQSRQSSVHKVEVPIEQTKYGCETKVLTGNPDVKSVEVLGVTAETESVVSFFKSKDLSGGGPIQQILPDPHRKSVQICFQNISGKNITWISLL